MVIKYKLLAVMVVVAFGAGWQVQAWRYDSDLLTQRDEMQKQINAANTRADIAAEKSQQVREIVKYKEKVVTRDIIKYVQDPNHTVCVFDNERVRLKSEILRAANTRSVPDK